MTINGRDPSLSRAATTEWIWSEIAAAISQIARLGGAGFYSCREEMLRIRRGCAQTCAAWSRREVSAFSAYTASMARGIRTNVARRSASIDRGGLEPAANDFDVDTPIGLQTRDQFWRSLLTGALVGLGYRI